MRPVVEYMEKVTIQLKPQSYIADLYILLQFYTSSFQLIGTAKTAHNNL